MKYVIVGFPKCGTVSLEQYLKNKHGDDNVVRMVPEPAWVPSGLRRYKEYIASQSDKCRPVMITRNNLDRLWSAYNYYDFFNGWTYEDFIYSRDPHYKYLGCSEVRLRCNYQPYIDAYKEFNPLVYKLEELQKLPDFPHKNKTVKPPIPDEFRRLYDEMMS